MGDIVSKKRRKKNLSMSFQRSDSSDGVYDNSVMAIHYIELL